MASRSLTDVFLLMRNNAIRSRHIYPDQVPDSLHIFIVRFVNVDYLLGYFRTNAFSVIK